MKLAYRPAAAKVRWRDKRTHKFVTWLWAMFRPGDCERCPDKEHGQ